MTEPDDPEEGQGDDTAYDGLAVEHLDSEAGQAEVAENLPEPGDDHVTVEPPEWVEDAQ